MDTNRRFQFRGNTLKVEVKPLVAERGITRESLDLAQHNADLAILYGTNALAVYPTIRTIYGIPDRLDIAEFVTDRSMRERYTGWRLGGAPELYALQQHTFLDATYRDFMLRVLHSNMIDTAREVYDSYTAYAFCCAVLAGCEPNGGSQQRDWALRATMDALARNTPPNPYHRHMYEKLRVLSDIGLMGRRV